MLVLASICFWIIKEKSLIKVYLKVFKNDKNIRYYILLNLLSFGILIIPFYVSYFKAEAGLSSKNIGNFFIGGFNLTAYRIVAPEILLEISNEKTRNLYTAISGVGNLLMVFIPLLNGFLISIIGYNPVFISSAIILLLSFFIIDKINCNQN